MKQGIKGRGDKMKAILLVGTQDQLPTLGTADKPMPSPRKATLPRYNPNNEALR